MAFHNQHKAFHGKRDSYELENAAYDNKYRYIHMAGKDIDNPDTVNPDNNNDNVVTIVSKIYVTEPKTFPGPAVYVTQTPVATETLGAGPTTHSQNSYESAKSVINQFKTRTSDAGDSSNPTAMKGSPLSQPEYIAQQNKGMSGGEKAGVAIGVLAAIGLVAGLILFCIRRRKKQLEGRGEKLDEKHVSQNSFFSGTAAAFGAPAGDKRESVKSIQSNHTAATAPRLSLRPVTQFLPGILENRKSTGNNNSLGVPPMSEKPRSASPQNPFEDGDGAAAAVPVAAGASPKSNANNVHRVQLDFKPSMDDELELKSGQLVRMLHEYDDGWALCIRMDRTQQGVCPRTCLSKLPVKPRPQGPSQGRPSGSPQGFRGPPPQGSNKLMPRPLTPTGRERSSTSGGRTESPSPMDGGRRRSQSVSAASDRSVSPIDSGIPARKPVPGQAI